MIVNKTVERLGRNHPRVQNIIANAKPETTRVRDRSISTAFEDDVYGRDKKGDYVKRSTNLIIYIIPIECVSKEDIARLKGGRYVK